MDKYNNTIPYTMYMIFLKKEDLVRFSFEELSSVVEFINNPEDIYLALSNIAKRNMGTASRWRVKTNYSWGPHEGFIRFAIEKIRDFRSWFYNRITKNIKHDIEYLKFLYFSIYFRTKAKKIERSKK